MLRGGGGPGSQPTPNHVKGKRMVHKTLAKGNLPTFSHASSTPNSLYFIIFCLAKTTIARIDSRRYNNKKSVIIYTQQSPSFHYGGTYL